MRGGAKLLLPAPLLLALLLSGLLLVLAAGPAWSQDRAGAVLFVSSSPLGARVSLQGRPQPGRTPLLFRDLEPGRYRVELGKDGYLGRPVEVTLPAGEVRSLSVELREQGVSAIFPEEEGVVVQGRTENARERIFYLERGAYKVSREQGIVYLDPAFPQQRLIDALNISIPIMLSFASILTINAVFSPPETDWPVPPAVVAAHGVTLSMIGLDIGLNVYKRKQMRSYGYSMRSQELSTNRAERYHEEAERLLERGRLEDALALYTNVLETFPDSPLLPWCLYRIAGIHYLKGENQKAIVAYQRTAAQFPVPELYDRCRKSLADILVGLGRYGDGLAQLDQMVFADPLFDRREIEGFRCEILAAWAEEDPSVSQRSRECAEEFDARYPGAAGADVEAKGAAR
jgi:tetratricopeptide (TPR) repeat protein